MTDKWDVWDSIQQFYRLIRSRSSVVSKSRKERREESRHHKSHSDDNLNSTPIDIKHDQRPTGKRNSKYMRRIQYHNDYVKINKKKRKILSNNIIGDDVVRRVYTIIAMLFAFIMLAIYIIKTINS